MAALGVMLIHYDGIGLYDVFKSDSFLDKILTKFVILGGQGPTVFFIASGYVLYQSYERQPNFSFFLISRYFRLMPLLFIVSFFAAIIQDLKIEAEIVILKLFFLDLFFNHVIDFSPVNIAFFVVIEFWLSFILILTNILPRKMSTSNKNHYYFILLIFSFLIHLFVGDISTELGVYRVQFDILRFQFWFIVGILLSIYRQQLPKKFPYLILSIFSLALAFFSTSYLGYWIGLSSVFFILSEKRSLNFYPLIFLGNICYSIYLIHQPAHLFLANQFFIESSWIFGIVIFVSALTFRIIEVPFINVGKLFVSKINVRP